MCENLLDIVKLAKSVDFSNIEHNWKKYNITSLIILLLHKIR